MADKAWKLKPLARVICALFGHHWQPSPNEEQYVAIPNGEGTMEPWGIFTRCSRCGLPNPYWPFKWHPDEEETADA